MKPWGSYSICRATRLDVSSSRWKVTTPAWWTPSTVFQAMRSSGITSVSSATKFLSAPGSESCQAKRRSSIGSTRWTWLRNRGHWVTSLHRDQVTATGALDVDGLDE